MKEILVLRKEPTEVAIMTMIEPTKETLREIVGGDFDIKKFSKFGAIVSKKERIELPYNCDFLGNDYYGTIVVVGIDGKKLSDVFVKDSHTLSFIKQNGNMYLGVPKKSC